jgi:uncharacterized membrane protein
MSILPLFVQPGTTIINVGVRVNSASIMNLSTGIMHAYNHALIISEGWWAAESDTCQVDRGVQITSRATIFFIFYF